MRCCAALTAACDGSGGCAGALLAGAAAAAFAPDGAVGDCAAEGEGATVDCRRCATAVAARLGTGGWAGRFAADVGAAPGVDGWFCGLLASSR